MCLTVIKDIQYYYHRIIRDVQFTGKKFSVILRKIR